VLPRGRANADSVYGGFFDLNGNGELTGQSYLQDFGVVIGPIGISNTNAIGQVYAGIQQWTQHKFGVAVTPVVAETWDGRLNDLDGFHVQPADAVAAIEAARTGPVAEGNVGGGTGMVCFGFGDRGGQRVDRAELLYALGGDLVELAHHGRLIVDCIRPRELILHDDNVGMAVARSQFLDLCLRQCTGESPTREKYGGNGSAASKIERGFHESFP
jgi:hypothetical protein